MTFVSKLTPEQWAECRRLRAEGYSYPALSERFGISADCIGQRARREGWSSRGSKAATKAAPRKPSPVTSDIRRRLAEHFFSIIEIRIRMKEKALQKAYDKLEKDPTAEPTELTKQECDTFAALIGMINQVTEMASEPASAANGGRKFINPELTALSDELDADALAEASEKDRRTAQLAEQLAKSVRPV
jgi:hypothetical protein